MRGGNHVAWTGLDAAYQDMGLARYFAGFVISEDFGCNKPVPRMFRAGADLLGFDPAECLFVEDHPPHVAAAIELGYQGRVICRGPSSAADVPTIALLTNLPNLLV